MSWNAAVLVWRGGPLAALDGAASIAPQHLSSGHLPRSREDRERRPAFPAGAGSRFVGCDLNRFFRLIFCEPSLAPAMHHAHGCRGRCCLVFLTPPPPRPSFRLGKPTFRHGLLPFTDIPTRLRHPRAAPRRTARKVFHTADLRTPSPDVRLSLQRLLGTSAPRQGAARTPTSILPQRLRYTRYK